MGASGQSGSSDAFRGVLSAGIRTMMLGLLTVPSEDPSFHLVRAAEQALNAALDRLDADTAEPDISDIERELERALSPLADAGFGPEVLYSRAWHCERGFLSETLRREAVSARLSINPQWAGWLDAVLRGVLNGDRCGWKKEQAILRAIDTLHEVDKFYGNGWDQGRELAMLARIDGMLRDLAHAGLGTIELEAAFSAQRQVPDRKSKNPTKRNVKPKGAK